MTYNEAPPKLTMLYALETPEIGGDTAFANQELAYASLSDGIRKTIDPLEAIHSQPDSRERTARPSRPLPKQITPW
ncbi:MAG: hypothetical protein CM1200mP9_10920 [Gammaproteobacteria bacterium]|nr:MAG: hypothetical protein CM1200mP9_10920 [Gammaproteobacteria bacterium]